ncbi:MAG: SGNH/GDSL hydrolase family protein [Actinomycetota bacterium]|nr:SGNH/GDSL hydrolase family protein [Actinomycetota bacterium]
MHRTRDRRSPHAAVVTIVLAAIALTALTTPVPAHGREPVHYVALGDSRAASPTLTTQLNGCGRSPDAYPNQLAALIKPATFRSVACAGAKAENILDTPQLRLQGWIPPQIGAVRADTDLITLSIGGNDTDWGNLSRVCFAPLPGVDMRCRDNTFYVNAIRRSLEPLEKKVERVLRTIRQRSPQATVAVIGQGGYFGDHGCFPANPASDADIAFIRSDYFGPYNDILRRVAQRYDALFIDVEAQSDGHDACAGTNKWFEGYLTSSEYLGFHPTAAGNRAIAHMIADALPTQLRP